jgi:hypothetical protein
MGDYWLSIALSAPIFASFIFALSNLSGNCTNLSNYSVADKSDTIGVLKLLLDFLHLYILVLRFYFSNKSTHISKIEQKSVSLRTIEKSAQAK